MPQVILAIDQGTTGTTVFVVDARGRIRGRAYAEIKQYYPKPGWVEHDPEEIFRSVVTLSKKAIAAAKVTAAAIAGVGITNQRETFVVWERRSGRPVYRAIVWQCRRSAAICEALLEREPEVASRTGLLIDPYFSGTKLKWLLDQKPELRARGARGRALLRHHRHLADVQVVARGGVRDRLHQRVAHDDVQPRASRMGRRDARDARRAARDAAAGG